MTREGVHRPLTTDGRVRTQVSPCVIYGEQIGTGAGLSPSYLVFPNSIIHHCSILIQSSITHVT
jgi:hypothetical protein